MPPTTAPTASLENELSKRLADIEKQISDLEAERKVVQRLMLKVRSENVGTKDVTRRNSLQRILIERRIIETITNAHAPVSSHVIYNAVKDEVGDVRDNTFRSHLHRLKIKGVIEPQYKGGPWRLRPVK